MINDGEDMVVTVQEYFESLEANGNFSIRNDKIMWVSNPRSETVGLSVQSSKYM